LGHYLPRRVENRVRIAGQGGQFGTSSAYDTFVLSVKVNNPPQFTSAPVEPAWLSLIDHGDGTATLVSVPLNDDVGDHAVTLRAEDSKGAVDTQSFSITVTADRKVYLPLVVRGY
jgi:hypothetical protein